MKDQTKILLIFLIGIALMLLFASSCRTVVLTLKDRDYSWSYNPYDTGKFYGDENFVWCPPENKDSVKQLIISPSSISILSEVFEDNASGETVQCWQIDSAYRAAYKKMIKAYRDSFKHITYPVYTGTTIEDWIVFDTLPLYSEPSINWLHLDSTSLKK